MKKLIILILLSAFVNSYAQKKGTVLFTMGNEPVYLNEFQYIYEKNNKNDSNFYKPDNIKEYLNLFINFKLKVKEARNRGTDTSAAFRKEFKTYHDQLSAPYFIDKSTLNRLELEAYDRMKTEVRASHIMVRCAEDALPADTLKAYKKILDIYTKLKNGDDFEKTALQYSDDPSVKYNKGNLGYFSVFNLIYPFETKAYNTPNGQISEIFRTQFGYHILKITDRRAYQGQIKVAQILVKRVITTGDTIDHAKPRIDSVYQKLVNGAIFTDLVRLYSDDERTKRKNGELPQFAAFSYQVPEIIKANAFSLKKDGDFSKPFKTDQGWVILRRIELKGMDSFKKMEPQIKNSINSDSRYQLVENAMYNQIYKEYKVKENNKALGIFDQQLDTSLLSAKWKIKDPGVFKKTLFTIGKDKHSQLEFAKYIELSQGQYRFNNVPSAQKKLYSEFLKQAVIEYANSHLEDKYPDFHNLVNEYKEGMMLFDITDKMVWAKAMNDTIGQEAYYSQNKNKYMWKKRVEAEIYTCKTPDVANQVVKYLENNKISADSIANLLNKKDLLNISYSKGVFEEGDSSIINNYFGQTGIIQTGNQKNQVIYLKKYDNPEPKKLSEVRGLVISEYQNVLEKKWVEDLKSKFPVVINEQALESMYKK